MVGTTATRGQTAMIQTLVRYWDVQQVRVIMDRGGHVLISDQGVLRRWKEYFEDLMNV